jgi:hypothetical protein
VSLVYVLVSVSKLYQTLNESTAVGVLRDGGRFVRFIGRRNPGRHSAEFSSAFLAGEGIGHAQCDPAAWEAMRIGIDGSLGSMAERLPFESTKALKENWSHRAQGWASVELASSSFLMGRRVSRMMATVLRPESSPMHWSRYPAYESTRLDGARVDS